MNEPFVPIEDLAKHFSVSISTVRAWVRQKHIPKDTYIKIGNTYRFRIGDVSHALTKKEEVGLPIYIDELTEIKPQEASAYAYQITSGIDEVDDDQ